jgi:hypothetical protein
MNQLQNKAEIATVNTQQLFVSIASADKWSRKQHEAVFFLTLLLVQFELCMVSAILFYIVLYKNIYI